MRRVSDDATKPGVNAVVLNARVPRLKDRERRDVERRLEETKAECIGHGNEHATRCREHEIRSRDDERRRLERVRTKRDVTAKAFRREGFVDRATGILGFAHPMKQDGVLPVFGGGETYPFPMVATRDIGATAASALLAAPTSTQWIELSGPKEYSFVDAATEATAIVGKPVKAVPLPIDGLIPALVAVGFSEEMATLYREMNEAFGKGAGFEGKGKAVRGTTVLADVLQPALT